MKNKQEIKTSLIRDLEKEIRHIEQLYVKRVDFLKEEVLKRENEPDYFDKLKQELWDTVYGPYISDYNELKQLVINSDKILMGYERDELAKVITRKTLEAKCKKYDK